MNPLTQHQLNINRRHFFGKSANGIGTAALATLLGREGLSAAPEGKEKIPAYIRQIAPKAKRVIYLF
ncbi:MAG: sulfatase, partial [Verrucomicrobiaceae bacterium]|nr:sulfatase [Verrucomicrobiaceae bacterium]